MTNKYLVEKDNVIGKQMTLTVKMESFANEYITTGNASEAYRRSYNATKMKPQSIHVNACKLLASTKIALRINELRSAIATKHGITVDSLIEELEDSR